MLKVNNIDVSFGRKKVLKNVSFEVKPGQIVGLIGPNGAGKTTTMKTILGLLKFTGSVTINGKEVNQNNHEALKHVGALIEHPAIYPFLTGLQNLQLYSKDEKDMHQVVSLLKMDTYIKTKSKDYSLGMKQKLGIAIALLNKPDLIILDEPMNGLDIESTILVRKIIKQYAENGAAFLISSHILAELQKVMTDVLILKNGKIILNRSLDELYQMNSGQYKIRTSDMNASSTLLLQNNIKFISENDVFIINVNDIKKVEDLFSKNHIYLLELDNDNGNLEKIVVKILENEGINK